MSGAGSAELPFEEWERLWMSSETCSSQLGSQVGDRVSSLISKMMINNQFNIVGEGYEFINLVIILLWLDVISSHTQ